MTSVLDLAPTVLDLLGFPRIADSQQMQGHSLLPLIEAASGVGGQGPVPPATAASRSPHHAALYLTECTWMRKRGWRSPDWKLIRALEPDIYGKPPVELYDLRADPREQVNVADCQPQIVAALTGEMERWVAERMLQTGHADPLLAQSDALRIWQPRFIAGKQG